MKQTICTAQVDECTKVGDILYNTVNSLTNLDTLEQFLLQLSLLC